MFSPSRSAVCLALVFVAPSLTGQLPRPNIVFVFTDDHASHAISAYGSRINQTPNIDRLANEGMLFRNCFCTNSICAPSRAVILTGKHSHKNGQISNAEAFDGRQQTFPKLLQKVGYQTAIVGKWHLKTEPTGFDHWEVLRGQGPYYNPRLRTAKGDVQHTGYTTDILTNRALEWLQGRDPERPFMLMFQHKAPHRNWQPGPKYLTMYDDQDIPVPATLFDDWATRTSATGTQTMTIADHLTKNDLKLTKPRGLNEEQLAPWNAAYGPKNEAFRKAELTGAELVHWKYQRYIKDYLRCIASVDDNLGRFLDYLDQTGLSRNTVVIYSSDQGFYLGDHGWFDKRWMYEESLRMPLIVRWPGVTRPGTENRDLVQNLDFAETFLEMAGATVPADMQGKSLVPLLQAETPTDWRQSIYYHYWEFPGAHSVRRHYGVQTRRFKLIHYYAIDEWELFDLAVDPDEMRNLHGHPGYADVVSELEQELKRLQRQYQDDDPTMARSEFEQQSHRALATEQKPGEVMRLATPTDRAPKNLNPKAKTLTVGAHCDAATGDGVIVAHGGESFGYALYLKGRRPCFAVRNHGELRVAKGEALPTGEVHLAGTLHLDGTLRVWVDGAEAGSAPGFLLTRNPSDGLSIGRDSGSAVGDYEGELPFGGSLRDIRLFWGVRTPVKW